MDKNILNIGILAHVDAGKTTITENLLYLGGAIRSMGNVDKGSATTDNLKVEKERGISVRSVATSFEWKGTQINLIDTPGHIDFSAEVERVLRVLDGAILVISAVEGVQAHTYSLWSALKDLNIPCILFVNKIDRSGSDVLTVIDELKKELGVNLFNLQYPNEEGDADASIKGLWEQNFDSDIAKELKEKSLEVLAEHDEEILEDYLEGIEISSERIFTSVKNLCRQNKIQPALMGVAKNAIGTEDLLNTVVEYFPKASIENDSELSAVVFKLEHDKTLGRLAHIRLFSGAIKNRDTVLNFTQQTEEKVSQVKKAYINKLEDLPELVVGDIGIISGLPNVKVGDILGNDLKVPKTTSLNTPLLTVQVKATDENNYAMLAEALKEMASEDPLLDFQWLREDKELHVKIMGSIQMEILQIIIKNRFGIDVEFLEPTIIYKETPAKVGEGNVRYTMPKPCWAIMTFKIEPAEQGAGVIYESKVSVDKIKQKYQNEVERTIEKALLEGIKGWEVTDIKITLIDGEDHEIHSRPGDFILATPMGLMKALENTGTTLLEPILYFSITAPEEFLGKITSDLTTMRAEIGSPVFNGDKFTLKGSVPAATSIDYSIKFNSLTGGKGKLKFTISGYESCSDELGQIREYKGVNPLDESKWILHARGAYKRDEWKL